MKQTFYLKNFADDGLGGVPDEEATGLLRLIHILVKETDRHVVALLDADKHLNQAVHHWMEVDGIAMETASDAILKAWAGGVSRRARDESGIRRTRAEVLSLLS